MVGLRKLLRIMRAQIIDDTPRSGSFLLLGSLYVRIIFMNGSIHVCLLTLTNLFGLYNMVILLAEFYSITGLLVGRLAMQYDTSSLK